MKKTITDIVFIINKLFDLNIYLSIQEIDDPSKKDQIRAISQTINLAGLSWSKDLYERYMRRTTHGAIKPLTETETLTLKNNIKEKLNVAFEFFKKNKDTSTFAPFLNPLNDAIDTFDDYVIHNTELFNSIDMKQKDLNAVVSSILDSMES